MMYVKKILKNIFVFFSRLGINHRLFVGSVVRLPNLIKEFKLFKKLMGSTEKSSWDFKIYPILFDKGNEAASLGEYFWQDLFVAKQIIRQHPNRHIDVGSRIDGFIALLSMVREVEVFDIRPLSTPLDNVLFTQWDITQPDSQYITIADCVSCLHTLEHIGLGRYGDRIDPDGWKKGLHSLSSLLIPGGGLWLSVPIGIQRVEFNAHRVFNPSIIVAEASQSGLRLDKFFYLEDNTIHESENIGNDMEKLSKQNYGLGIFFFKK